MIPEDAHGSTVEAEAPANAYKSVTAGTGKLDHIGAQQKSAGANWEKKVKRRAKSRKRVNCGGYFRDTHDKY